jgi:hypothetical protein
VSLLRLFLTLDSTGESPPPLPKPQTVQVSLLRLFLTSDSTGESPGLFLNHRQYR